MELRAGVGVCPSGAHPVVQAPPPCTLRDGTSETGRLLPISGVSLSWFSRVTAPCIPSLLGTLVLFLELCPLLPCILRDQVWVWKSTFQSVAAWNGYGDVPPILPAMLHSLSVRPEEGAKSLASPLLSSEDS